MEKELLYEMRFKLVFDQNMGTMLDRRTVEFFIGEISGLSIHGKVHGLYYGLPQPNGEINTRSRGIIQVDGGGAVSLDAQGFVTHLANGRISLNESVTHKTSKRELAWLNWAECVATGFINIDTGELQAKVFKVK